MTTEQKTARLLEAQYGSLEWAGKPLNAKDVRVRYLNEDIIYPPEISESIKMHHKVLEEDPNKWDGTLLTLKALNIGESSITIDAGFASYSAYKATNIERGKMLFGTKDQKYLANPIILSTILLTKEKKPVLGIRSRDSEYRPGELGTFGGFANIDEDIRFPVGGVHSGYPLFGMLEHEILGEVGIPHDSVMESTSSRLFGIARDFKYFSPNLLFITETSFSASEIKEYFSSFGKKNEHAGIKVIEGGNREIEHILINERKITRAAKMGLSLYVERQIAGELT